MYDDAEINVKIVMHKFKLDGINDLDAKRLIRLAMLEAFHLGAVLGNMDSDVLKEAQNFLEEVE
jgi:hypothetical protein